ncbi:ABC transporter substrate-binding protein [Actinomadura violacea]|uniref:ABC transporter substrate-binding protein n=1 Tax=Actinomadura violacea TaxID=2819934 RepID=A0ABS3RZE9_9ACTN|nr:ABC transporter substrate-binding protein [Actinomadura violacea]MBO2462119.1 ABC transporter substrate-binding protein [Actinomadura violacea]
MNRTRTLAGLAALALLAAGCSSKAVKQDSVGSDGVKTGPGVTAGTITLGEMADLTGPFAANDTKITNAHQLYFSQLNEKGGVCGRKVRLDVVDHGYDVQKATTLYSDLARKVLGFSQVFGSGVNAALIDKYAGDKVLVYPASGAGPLLKSENILGAGSTYDYEVINALDAWLQDGTVKQGDTIAHVYLEGDYGGTAISGSRYMARKHGLKLTEVKIKPTDTDLTSQIAGIKNAGAKAILVSASPKQLGSVAVASESAGLRVPIVVNGAGWSGDLLEGASKKPALDRVTVAQSWAVPSMKLPVVQDFVAAYQKKYPNTKLDSNVTLGQSSAVVYAKVLQQACDDKDLTREGVLKAVSQLKNVDTEGLLPPLDYTVKGHAPATESLLLRPDAGVPGGVKAISETRHESKDIAGYTPDYAK